jgi:hypothetical protein
METLLIFTFTFSALSLGILGWIAFKIHALEGNLLEDIDSMLAQAVQVFELRVRDGIREAVGDLTGGVDRPEFNPVQEAIVGWIQNQRSTIDVTPRDGSGRFARGADGDTVEP